MEITRLTWAEVRARRMMRSGLISGLPGIADVAVALAGVHAQVMTSAELAIGLRVPGLTRSDIRSSDALVRSYGPRGTVHLFAADDLGRWTAFLSQVAQVPVASGLTTEQADLLVGAIGSALAEGAELTMDELDTAVVARAGDWAGELCMPAFGGQWPRWRQVLALASMRGELCFGPGRGRRVTYRRPAVLAPAGLTPAEVIPWAVRAYLHAYGPSTPARFANWLAIDPARAQSMFGTVELDEVDIEGTTAWDLAGAGRCESGTVAGVLLLPYFDSYSYRVGVLCPEMMYPGTAGVRALRGAYQNLVVDGLVAGIWQQRRSGSAGLAITVEPVLRLRPFQRDLVGEQATLAAAIQERTLSSLTFGTVRSGAHA